MQEGSMCPGVPCAPPCPALQVELRPCSLACFAFTVCHQSDTPGCSRMAWAKEKLCSCPFCLLSTKASFVFHKSMKKGIVNPGAFDNMQPG